MNQARRQAASPTTVTIGAARTRNAARPGSVVAAAAAYNADPASAQKAMMQSGARKT